MGMMNRTFTYRPQTIRIEWPDGHYLHGLEVVTTRPSFDVLMCVMSMGSADTTEAMSEKIGQVISALGGNLVDWNLSLDSDGGCVEPPASAEGLSSLDSALLMDIITGWSEAVLAASSIDTPLDQTSTPTSPGVEDSIPMMPA